MHNTTSIYGNIHIFVLYNDSHSPCHKWLAQIQSARALREPWLWLALNNIPCNGVSTMTE